MAKQVKQAKRLKAVRGNWYVVGWTDADPMVALCVDRSPLIMDTEFFFPGQPSRGMEAAGIRPWSLDNIDAADQLLADLGPLDIPAIPEHLRAVRLEEDR